MGMAEGVGSSMCPGISECDEVMSLGKAISAEASNRRTVAFTLAITWDHRILNLLWRRRRV